MITEATVSDLWLMDAGPPPALRGLEQAALLAAAVQAQRASAADELRAWQAAPFLDAVLRQRRTRFLLRAAARLLRRALELAEVSGQKCQLHLRTLYRTTKSSGMTCICLHSPRRACSVIQL